ncbi:MAG: hypothetical protein NTY59_10005 [Alphaproteobacteria bacterium]|nr:hypothetical protein [Alphaproteobacteria bacterium]
MKIRYALLLAATMMAFAASAMAGYDDGQAAFERGDFAAARREWEPLAKAGDARALYSLGMLEFKGLDGPRNYVRAADLFQISAGAGNVRA